MKYQLILPLLIFSLTGCQENESIVDVNENMSPTLALNAQEIPITRDFTTQALDEPRDAPDFGQFFEPYRLGNSHHRIDPGVDNLIDGPKGTRLLIPANSFVLEDGTEADGEVLIRLKECYTISDFIKEDLSCYAGDQMLESGGTVKITASCNGKEVHVRPEKEIGIAFPSNGTEFTDMSLFSGTRNGHGDMNWDELPENQIAGMSMARELGFGKIGVTTKDTSAVYVQKWSAKGMLSNKAQWRFNNGESALDYIKQNPPQSQAITDVIIRRNKMNAYLITFDGTGRIKKVEADIPADPIVDEQIISYLEKLPAADVDKMPLSAHSHSRQIKVSFAVHEFERTDYEDVGPSVEEYFGITSDEVIEDMDDDFASYYLFKVRRLGWLNCDRFFGIPKDQRVPFFVQCDEPEAVNLKVIFENMNSALVGTRTSNGFSFPNLPKGQPIKIVAFRQSGKQPLMANYETTVQKGAISSEHLDFKPFSLSDLNTL